MQIKATVPALELEATVDYNFGENLDEAIGLFGEDVIFNYFTQKAVIALQGFTRSKMTTKVEGEVVAAEITDEDLQAIVDGWKPGVVQRSGKSQVEKLADKIGGLSDDEKAALLASLQG